MLKRWAVWPRGIRWLVGIAAVVVALAIVWVLMVAAPDWLARHDVGSAKGALLQTARDAARGRLLGLGAGLFAAGALVFTALNFNLLRRNSEQADQWQRRTHELTERAQVADRYTKAIEQLGSDKPEVRIGGIYALERVARDSARDHPTVMEALTAFIRGHSHEQPSPPHSGGPEPERSTRPDIQAALTVVGRRNAEPDIRPIDLTAADLTAADLGGANLVGANLTSVTLTRAIFARRTRKVLTDAERANRPGGLFGGPEDITRSFVILANLTGADLTGADLYSVDLSGANLTRATLSKAQLTWARLSQAELFDADLTGATLHNANLYRVILDRAKLTGADLAGADLTDAKLHSVDLRRVGLGGATLTGADLSEADLTGVSLHGMDLASVRLGVARLQEADFSRANLRDAYLYRANLISALFISADLTGANLDSVDLTGAKLADADLTRATLRHADLTHADLNGVNLTDADLTFAKLDSTDLTYAELGGVRWPVDAPVPGGWKLDTGSGRLAAEDADSASTETS